MDISALGGTALTEQAKMTYNIACMKMAQQSENVAQYLILDSVEIAKEAMDKYLAEKQEQ